ncbi:WD40/YVTN/BNR-like repeat-containing protein [Gorillibacterium massiliense]|uniref:WD40/YVTN/BNR-like repeat-containing protein n=1 Tax=Gorillibacterium massiliense TaxID=1280390 RepID=UPI0004BC7A61|nr:hypothetical protein [Gorillibacterium massiliense]
MKKTLLLLCLVLSGGCSLNGTNAEDSPQSNPTGTTRPTTASASVTATLTSEPSSPAPLSGEAASFAISPSPTGEDQSETEQPVHTREETFRLNDNLSWKAEYAFYGMFREDMILSRSEDGGASWNVVAKSGEGNGNLPNGIKTGLLFLDENKGWITSYSPRSGVVGISETEDGGRTWAAIQLEVPQKAVEAEITAFPPLFVSSTDGILITTVSSDEHPFLFYVTHDGGKAWMPVCNRLSGESQGLRWEFTKDPDTAGYSGTVSFRKNEWSFSNGSFSS